VKEVLHDEDVVQGMEAMVEERSKSYKTTTQRVGLFLGPLLFILTVVFMDLDPEKHVVTRMAAVAIIMAVWWITHAIPLSATALLPMVLYPLLGIMKGKATAPIYFNSTIFLFLGGFMIALTMEKWDLHKRIALWIIRTVGGGPSRIILGFMLASAFLSMWISNTATTEMILPILATVAVAMKINPLMLMIPAALSASCAFMMSVATPQCHCFWQQTHQNC
jgi:sodium-dependent dicarboxylate transporter 2/3/5